MGTCKGLRSQCSGASWLTFIVTSKGLFQAVCWTAKGSFVDLGMNELKAGDETMFLLGVLVSVDEVDQLENETSDRTEGDDLERASVSVDVSKEKQR
jgi:uncharacterized protein related to proFAR isomerase